MARPRSSVLQLLLCLLASAELPTRRHIAKVLRNCGASTLVLRSLLRFLGSSRSLAYMPNVCAVGLSLVLARFEGEDSFRRVCLDPRTRPFLELRTALARPICYTVHAVPTELVEDVVGLLEAKGGRAYTQAGYYECVAKRPRRASLYATASATLSNPLASLRGLARMISTPPSSVKQTFRELADLGFFRGALLLARRRVLGVTQTFFVEPKEGPGWIKVVRRLATFSRGRERLVLGVAFLPERGERDVRGSELIGTYRMYISNLLNVPLLMSDKLAFAKLGIET